MKAFRDIIRVEILSTAVEIRALKRWSRTRAAERPERPATRFALHGSKQRATLLCMTMAHSRGRLHVRTRTLDEQAAMLVEALAAMERMKVQAPLLDASLRDAVRAILACCAQSARPGHACVAPTEERRA